MPSLFFFTLRQLITPFAVLCFSLSVVNCKGRENDNSIEKVTKPNIILILADDLGYGDLGCYGQEKIKTPSLDRLAESGIRFTRHYSGAPVCAPSRCVLLTGMHSGHAQVRGNDEWQERGDVWNYKAAIADSTLEGQKPLSEGTITMGHLLRNAGYVTAVIGKWGLGAPHTNGIPNKQGFDYFFGYNCQRQAHTYYPVFLYKNEKRVLTGNDTIAPHTGFEKGTDIHDLKNYNKFNQKFYSPDLIFNEVTRFVEENRNGPFFLLWTPTIPHLPLQAPQSKIDEYNNTFGDEEPYDGSDGYFPARYPHATYAAMVSYLDEQIGNLISHLRTLQIYDKTLIFFTSDNGPASGAGTDSPWFDSGGPFRSEYGRGKGFLYEGGIRVPMIASWPGVIKPGSLSDHPSAFWDFLPTLCEIGGIVPPENIDGISFFNELMGKKQDRHRFLYWESPEYGGQQAVIIGEMKAIRREINNGNTSFELYDLVRDPGETTNIAAQNPGIIKKVKKIIRREHSVSLNEKWQFKTLGE